MMSEYFIETLKFYKKINNIAILFTAIIALFTNAAAQSESQCAIRGNVVDDLQKPVVGSYLHWYPKYDGGLDFISVNGKSNENGSFEYREGCPAGNLTLYVTSSLSFENYTPILPPFAYGSKLDKKVKGMQINENKRVDINLGNVPVQIYYSTVSVKFTDSSGNNLFLNKIDWENALVRLKDKSGKLFSVNKLSADEIEKAVRISDSGLTFDLPVEEWLIEIRQNQYEKNWLKADKLIKVEKNSSPAEITLRMIESR